MSLCGPLHISLLQLLQLSDTALPIGSLSHSFGVESLVFDGDLESNVERSPASLANYLDDSLCEWLLADAVYCREAHARGVIEASVGDLNENLSAFRLARESREASLTMGRRFAALAAVIEPSPALIKLSKLNELHHAIAFGYTFAVLGVDVEWTVGAYLHQAVLNAISAAQRLMPLGQIQANRIAWSLKPAILATMEESRNQSFSIVCCFSHLPETASMRHPCLPTRLFVS